MIFVTGADGFVGRRVVARLRRDGQPLRLLGAGDVPAPDDGPPIERIDARVEEPWRYAERLRGVRTVLHLASKNVDADGRGFAVNVEAARALADACRGRGVRHVIYLSSTGVYGHRPLRGADESTPLRPDTALSRSKAAVEHLLGDGHRDDFATTILRPRFVHGPGDRAFVPALVRAVERHRLVPLSGRARVSLVHVDDVAELCARLCRREATRGETFHVTDGREYRVRALFESVARARGVAPPRFVAVPLPVLYHPLVAYERLAGRDPEGRVSGLTSRRLQFLGQDNTFSTERLRRHEPTLAFRGFGESLVVPPQGS